MTRPLVSTLRAATPPPRGNSPGGETVLLVDDDSAVRTYLRLLLRGRYTVLEAADGAEAIRVGQAHRGPLHLLLTDVEMTGVGGREVAATLRPTHPGMRVLYVSGHPDDRDDIERDAGADFLGKPFTPAALAAMVRQALDRRDAWPAA